MENEWSAGVDWTRFSRDRNNVWSAENTYKIDGNIYENNTSPALTIVWDPITPHQKMMMRSLAVLDTISSPDERMMFTFGVHWHEVETTNYVNKSYIKSHAASPVLGLIYKFTPGFLSMRTMGNILRRAARLEINIPITGNDPAK